MSLEPNLISSMSNFPPLFEKLGLNLSTTQLIILQIYFFTLLAPPTQYHKPMRKPLCRKAESKKLSKFYSKILGISCHSLHFPQLFQSSPFILFSRTKHSSLLTTWAFCPPVLLSTFLSHFPEIIHIKLLLTTFNGSVCLQIKSKFFNKFFSEV